MDIVVKLFISFFFVLYMLVAFVWPTYRTWKQTGINPLTFGNADTTHDLVGKWFKIILTIIPFNILMIWLGMEWYTYLLPAWYLEFVGIKVVGMMLCVLSWCWTVLAQHQMGNSWRIGIDEKHKTAFVVSGVFGLSRNPIFLGMLLTLIGTFLIIPNALSLLVLVSGFLLIQIQIRLEEEFLLKQYGSEYESYKRRVRRWL